MLRLILKNIDLGTEDLNVYIPEIPENFCVWLTLTIGSAECEGSNLFQVGLCTPSWLAHQLSIEKFYVLRHMILVDKFDFLLIKKIILAIIKDSQRATWDESIAVLCRYFAWEYEDYLD